jgi:GGDEF domain-containing protein
MNVPLLRTALLLVAVVSAATALVHGAASGAPLSAALGAATVTAIVMAVGLERLPSTPQSALLTKISAQADIGRKLAIYERETGLFAQWYLSLRCEEECRRAKRYEHALAVLLIEASPSSKTSQTNDQAIAWLRNQLRTTDIAGYLGNGRYAVVMPETGIAHAKRVAKRALREIDASEAGLSSYPDDGATLDELCAAACERLAGPKDRSKKAA